MVRWKDTSDVAETVAEVAHKKRTITGSWWVFSIKQVR